MSISSWIVWGLFLLAQNFSFTFVSRARNSGSLKRHMMAALLSNAIWFGSQIILITDVVNMIKGGNGFAMALFAGLFYTVVTVAGSLWAHKICLSNESGSEAVGANDKYAQITKEEWDTVKTNTVEAFSEVIDWVVELAGNVRKLEAVVKEINVQKSKRTNRKTAKGAAGKGPVRKRVARAGNRS